MEGRTPLEEPKTLSPQEGQELARQLEAAGLRDKQAPPIDTSQRLSPEDGAKAWRIAQEIMRQRAEAEARAQREAMPTRPDEPKDHVQELSIADIQKALIKKDAAERAEKKQAVYRQLQEIYGS